MKIELRDFKRRDGAVYVDLDPTQSNDLENRWLDTLGAIGAMVAGAVLALAWLIIL